MEKRFAIYLGKEYEAHRDKRITLYSTDIEDVSKGFEPCEPYKSSWTEKEIVCTKTVEKSEITSYYYKRIIAIYKGCTFGILEKEEDMLSIVTGDYRVAEDIGMSVLEKGVYQKWIKKEEAEFMLEIEGDFDNDDMKAIWQLLNLETKEMKKGTFAVYLGKTYITTTDETNKILLYSTDIEDISKGFEACEPFQILGIKKEIVCTKYVELSELESYFKVRTKGRPRLDEVDIIGQKGKMLSIMVTENLFDIARKGKELIAVNERTVTYQKWVTRVEVRTITLEIEELANNQDIQSVWRLLNLEIKDMKEKTFAIHLGKAYIARTTLDGNFVLYSTSSEDVSKGFEKCKPFQILGVEKEIVCMKYVSPPEVDSYFKVKVVAEHQGYEFEVVEEKDDMLSVITIYEYGRIKGDKVWEGIGMTPVDKYRHNYQKWIKRKEAKIKFEIEELLNNIKMEELE